MALPGGQNPRQLEGADFRGCRKTKYAKMVTVPVSNVNTTQFNLPTDDTLRSGRITGIEVVSLDDVTVGPQNLTPVNATVFSKSYLTVKSSAGNEEILSKIPLERLRAFNNTGLPYPICIEQLNPSDCFIDTSNVTALVANEVFMLIFHFERR